MTDQQLKALFPKLLPGRVHINPKRKDESQLWWKPGFMEIVKDNQLLSLCREVEETFTEEQLAYVYPAKLAGQCQDTNTKRQKECGTGNIHASWQQRIQAAAEVKGIL